MMSLLGLLLLPLGLITYFSVYTLIINLAAFILIALLQLKKMPRSLPGIILIWLMLGFLVSAIFDGQNLREWLSEPHPPPYIRDMGVYLNTVYEYRQTGDYYFSLATSLNKMDLNIGSDRLAGEIWGWKQPLIFTLWKFLPGSSASIQWLAVLAFSVALLAIYDLNRKFLPGRQAILAPFLVWPYFHYPLIEQTMMQVEWWALVCFLIGLALYFRQRMLWASLAFAFCLAIRELFAIPILGLGLLLLAQRQFKNALRLGLPIIIGFLPYYFLFHLPHIFKYETFNLFSGGTLRSGAAMGWEYIRTTLAYNSWSYLLWRLRPFLLLLILNSLGLVVLLLLKKKPWSYLSLLVAYLLFFLLSFKLGIMDVWHDYWGIYYVPILLAVTPIVYIGLYQYFRPPKAGFKQ